MDSRVEAPAACGLIIPDDPPKRHVSDDRICERLALAPTIGLATDGEGGGCGPLPARQRRLIRLDWENSSPASGMFERPRASTTSG